MYKQNVDDNNILALSLSLWMLDGYMHDAWMDGWMMGACSMEPTKKAPPRRGHQFCFF